MINHHADRWHFDTEEGIKSTGTHGASRRVCTIGYEGNESAPAAATGGSPVALLEAGAISCANEWSSASDLPACTEQSVLSMPVHGANDLSDEGLTSKTGAQ
jgi:hypothetical protein